ncbi:hypothetical protein RGQ29_024795 [Quercus rubra]|uniref:Glutaredoxin n=1 Tax=Quercus rubra TaxID=3512 RepID=A0AAN7EX19_QUERU|nr:hypothetical protein RGQ29_024795 [Quercus rubra]
MLMRTMDEQLRGHMSNGKVFGSFSHNGRRFSTTVPNDPDTHEDFKPTNKLESSDLSLNDVVEPDVKENPIMIYMKGVPEFPQCGFSSLAVRVLKQYSHIVHAIWQGQRFGAVLDDIVFSHSHRCIHCISATEPKLPNHS